MSILFSTPEVAASVTVLGVAVLFYTKYIRRSSNLPPGPKPLPIIGNFLDLPKNDQWSTYEKWSRQYGSDIIYLNVLGTNILVVNSAAAATDVFEKKSALYSDRPPMPMITDLIGLHWHFAFAPHGDSWRNHRKIFSKEYNPTAALRFRSQELKWTHTFLQNLLTAPGDFLTHIQHMASGIVLETTYGLQVQPSGQPDPFIGAAKGSIEGMGAAGLYGTYLVDYLPLLKHVPAWFPFAKFKKEAAHWRTFVDIAATVPFAIVKQAMADGTATPSITTTLLQNLGTDARDSDEETAIRQSGAAMFASGSAATVSALGTFFLAMTLYPEVQAKAQKELDQILEGRLPEFSDEASLPYISAILKEVLRWKPVVPLAFPHMLTTDDIYNGYHLPAGSVVIPNAWAILHDPAVYPDPSTFNPERFLTQDGKLNPHAKGPDAAFGFARRSCPGKHMAIPSMWIAIASTLAVFDISKALDGRGSVIEPSGEYTPGLLSYPLPFECEIRPRSKEAESLITSTKSE